MRALITANIPEKYMNRLNAIVDDPIYTGRGYTGSKLSEKEMIENIRDRQIVIHGVETVDAKVMDAARELQIIACCRNEAFASVDIEAATARGIPVIASVGRNAISVAEYTIGILLACCKNIVKADYALRHTDDLVELESETDAYIDSKNPPSFWGVGPGSPSAVFGGFPELYGKNFGQIGFGGIGREVAKRAYAFGMNVLVCDPFATGDAIRQINGTLVDLPGLMKESDFISINCNVNPSTIGMVNGDMIALMKPDAFIVNTARAPIMDYEALYSALLNRKIAGAALDVYPREPLPKNDKLRKLDNVVMTPHLAGQAKEIIDHQAEIILRNIEMLLKGERPDTICNPQVLEKWFKERKNELL